MFNINNMIKDNKQIYNFNFLASLLRKREFVFKCGNASSKKK